MSNYISTFTNKIKNKAVPPLNDVLLAFKTLKNVPGGLTLLSKVVSRVAPYFQTVNPMIQKLDLNLCEASIKKINQSKIISGLYTLLPYVMGWNLSWVY